MGQCHGNDQCHGSEYPCCEKDAEPTVTAVCEQSPTTNGLYIQDEAIPMGSCTPGRESELTYSRLRRIFQDCDKDGSGDLSLSELIGSFRADTELAKEYGYHQILQAETDEDVAKFFKEMDKDGNLHVTWDEFRNYITAALRNPPDQRPRNPRRNSVMRFHTNTSTAHNGLETLSPEHVSPATPTVNVQNWSIDYWSLKTEQALSLVHQALKEMNCLEAVAVPVTVLSNFFDRVEKAYRKNPYHNFQHGLATMHYTFKMLMSAGLVAFMTELELFSAIIAGICHDIDHRGRNTGFEVATLSELALRYGDDSPLERHHVAQAFEIAFFGGAGGPCNIYTRLSKDDFTYVRNCITEAILGTDMAKHNLHLENLRAQKSPQAESSGGGKYLLSLFLHMADIGNPTMPTDISFRWGGFVIEEFTAQVQEERSLGLPITKMMDGLTTPLAIAKCQLGFIDFVVSPLAMPIFTLYKDMTELKKHMHQNRAMWEQMAKS